MSLIEQYLARTGLTRAELAKRIRASPQAVSDWIIHGRIPRRSTMDRLAAEMNIETKKLVAEFYR